MDCKYIQQNEIHERYLLNQLSEPEKDRYEKHIAECSSCKRDLEKQNQLIAGIRIIGKQEMKSEIRTQVEEAKAQQKTPDWPMILKVAAVVFIIALIPSALYYFQTDSGDSLSQLPKAEQLETKEDTYYAVEVPRQQEKSETAPADLESPTKEQTPLALEQAAVPEPPASEIMTHEARSKYESDSVIRGRGVASGETAVLDEAEDSIGEVVPQETAPAQLHTSHVEIDSDELQQELSGGVTYQFAQTTEEGASRFETEEITRPQKFDAPGAQKLTPNYRTKAKGSIAKRYAPVATAVFKAEDKRITIYFETSQRELILDKESKLPQSFDVLVLNRDSVDWKMRLQVNEEFLDYDPSQREIVINDQTLYLTILEDYIYRIDLDNDSTKAILLER